MVQWCKSFTAVTKGDVLFHAAGLPLLAVRSFRGTPSTIPGAGNSAWEAGGRWEVGRRGLGGGGTRWRSGHRGWWIKAKGALVIPISYPPLLTLILLLGPLGFVPDIAQVRVDPTGQ